MSKIALKPADTGSATFTLEAPATNTNRTLTLPDVTGTLYNLDSNDNGQFPNDVIVSNDLTVNGVISGDGSGLTNILPSTIAFKTLMIDNSNINDTATPTVRSVFNSSPQFNSGGFSVTQNQITVPVTGFYVLSFNCFITSSSDRTNVGVSVDINGVQQSEESASNYIRNNDGHNESSTHLTAIYSLSENDLISLRFFQLAGGGTVTLQGNKSSINLHKLP